MGDSVFGSEDQEVALEPFCHSSLPAVASCSRASIAQADEAYEALPLVLSFPEDSDDIAFRVCKEVWIRLRLSSIKAFA